MLCVVCMCVCVYFVHFFCFSFLPVRLLVPLLLWLISLFCYQLSPSAAIEATSSPVPKKSPGKLNMGLLSQVAKVCSRKFGVSFFSSSCFIYLFFHRTCTLALITAST